MKRPEQHQIDELAQRILRQSLPPSWIINEQTKDYGKDYLVEISSNSNELTGTTFFVQLKGQKSVRLSKDKRFAKYHLKSKYAHYYAKHINNIPVFLIVIDTSTGDGYWLFIQSYLENKQPWKGSKGLTIDLPTENKLNESTTLAKAVEDALTWLRVRDPSSIPDAVAAYRKKLEGLDQRFEVSVSYHNDRIHAWLSPRKEPVSIRLKVTGEPEAISEKVKDLVERGRKVRLEDGEFEFEGSALFTAQEPGPIELQFSRSHQGAVNVILFDAEKKEISRADEIAGTYTGGVSELCFASTMPRLPIYAEAPSLSSTGGSLTFRIDLSAWDGMPILHLPYFEKIHDFLSALDRARYLKTKFAVEGVAVAESQLLPINSPSLSSIAQIARSLTKARRVFQSTSLNPIWSLSQYNEDFFDTVNFAYALLFEEGIRRRMPGKLFKFQANRSQFNLDALQQSPIPSTLKITSEQKAVILDQEISLGIVAEEFSDVVLHQVGSDGASEAVEVEAIATPSTIHFTYILNKAADKASDRAAT